MDDTLEKIWELPVADEPVAGKSEVTETEEETEKDIPCQGRPKKPCGNPAVVRVTWQPCICGKTKTKSNYCIRCYETFPMVRVGNTTAREGMCSKDCGSNIYMINVGPVR